MRSPISRDPLASRSLHAISQPPVLVEASRVGSANPLCA
jgi:hypothetical protein